MYRPLIDSLQILKISDEEYFSDKYSHYISNSRLSALKSDNPESFFEPMKPKYSDGIFFGSLLHQLVLQPEAYELARNVERPTCKAGFMADYLYHNMDIYKASEEINYYRGKLNEEKIRALLDKCEPYWKQRRQYKSDKIPLFADKRTISRLDECIRAVSNDNEIQNLLHPIGLMESPVTDNEQAILLDIEADGYMLHLKAKLDNYTIDKETNTIIVNDLKTVGVADFMLNFNRYAYYRELAIYSWLLSLVAKKYYGMVNGNVQSNCLVVSTIPPYGTSVYHVSKSDYARGWDEFKSLLDMIVKYYKKGWTL